MVRKEEKKKEKKKIDIWCLNIVANLWLYVKDALIELSTGDCNNNLLPE